MSIIVEDGTGKADAEAYCDVDYVRAYCEARGYDVAALNDTRIEQLLRLATEYLLGYGPALQGVRVNGVQALDFPRKGMIIYGATESGVSTLSQNGVIVGGSQQSSYTWASNEVPKRVKDACALLAYKASSGPLTRDLKQQKKRTKVGPIETEYDTSSPQSVRYPDVVRLMTPFMIVVNPFVAKLERA